MTQDISTHAAGLINELYKCNCELQIVNKDGQIHINPKTFDFTYIGKWGNIVLSSIIKMNCINDINKKMMVISAHCLSYSQSIAGINIIAVNS